MGRYVRVAKLKNRSRRPIHRKARQSPADQPAVSSWGVEDDSGWTRQMWTRYLDHRRARTSQDTSRRVVVVGGPRTGKSHLARQYRDQGLPTFCTDPLSLVKYPEEGVTYLPEALDWSEVSQFVCEQWLPMSGPYCIEGIATVRALRKWWRNVGPCERIVVLPRQLALRTPLLKGQKSMHAAVGSMWSDIEPRYAAIVDYR